MATSYSECYDIFLNHINDVDILYPFQNETQQEYEDRVRSILLSTFRLAIVKFNFSQTNLSRDDKTEMFVEDLRQIEIEVIGLLMLREYYRKQLNFLASLKHSFSDKDWKSHDKANQMNQYRQMIKELQEEIKNLVVNNSYTSTEGKLEGWW